MIKYIRLIVIGCAVLTGPAAQAYFVMEENRVPLSRVYKPSKPIARPARRISKPKARPTSQALKPKAVPDCEFRVLDYPLQQIGTGNRGGKIDGYGSGTKLQDAFAMVVPDDWEMVTPERAVRTVKVDWRTGKDWISVLETIGHEHNLYFVVDWKGKKVLATSKRPTAEQVEAFLQNGKPSSAATGM